MQQKIRRGEGHARPPVSLASVAESGCMIAAVKNAPRISTGEAIDPGNGLFKLLVARLGERLEAGQGLEGDGIGLDLVARQLFQLDLGREDHFAPVRPRPPTVAPETDRHFPRDCIRQSLQSERHMYRRAK